MHTAKISHEIRNRAQVFVFHLRLHAYDPRIESLSAKANRDVAESMCRRFFDGLEIRYEMKIGRFQQFILSYAPDDVVVEYITRAAEFAINSRILNT